MLVLAATHEETITEALTLMVVGMTVVFCGLITIALLITLANWLFAPPALAPAKAPAPAAKAPSPAAAHDASLPPALIAVLTAAATAALGRPARVTWAQPYSRQGQRSWVHAGRQALMTSHRVSGRTRRNHRPE